MSQAPYGLIDSNAPSTPARAAARADICLQGVLTVTWSELTVFVKPALKFF